MNKNQIYVNYLLLTIIIILLFFIIKQNNQIQTDIANSGNYTSARIDDLTSIVQTYLIE